MFSGRSINISFKIILPLLVIFLLSRTSNSSEGFFTIQTGTYSLYALEYAGKQFNFLSSKLNENDRIYLRIEEGEKYYIVRLGMFERFTSAVKVLDTVKSLVPDAFILRETDFEDVKVLISYENHIYENPDKTSLSETPVAEKKQVPVEDVAVNNVPLKPEQIIQEESINNLIDEVAEYYYKQQYGKATKLVRKGLAEWPENPDLHAWYGATLLDMGFPEKAHKEYSKAVKLLPDVPEFHAGVGYSLLDIYIDRAKQSVKAFKKALEIDPYNVSALEGLGIIYVSIDKKHLATEIYDRLKDIDQDAAERLNEYITWGLDWGDE